MARTRIDIPEELEAGIRKRCESRNISVTEGVRQILALGWATWKDRGSANRVQRHRANQQTFRARLGPGVEVMWQDNAKNAYRGILVEKHQYNPKMWEVRMTYPPHMCGEGAIGAGISSVPAVLLKPVT